MERERGGERWSLLTLRSGCCRGRHRRDIAHCRRLSHKPAKAERGTHSCAPSSFPFCFWQQMRCRLGFQEPPRSDWAETNGRKLQRALSSGAVRLAAASLFARLLWRRRCQSRPCGSRGVEALSTYSGRDGGLAAHFFPSLFEPEEDRCHVTLCLRSHQPLPGATT